MLSREVCLAGCRTQRLRGPRMISGRVTRPRTPRMWRSMPSTPSSWPLWCSQIGTCSTASTQQPCCTPQHVWYVLSCLGACSCLDMVSCIFDVVADSLQYLLVVSFHCVVISLILTMHKPCACLSRHLTASPKKQILTIIAVQHRNHTLLMSSML